MGGSGGIYGIGGMNVGGINVGGIIVGGPGSTGEVGGMVNDL